MAFNLEVEFTGLCLYVVDAVNQRVGVLMPDARVEAGHASHEDLTTGDPHVGYLRFELGDLSTIFPPEMNDPRLPTHEGVIQFAGHTLEFDFGTPDTAGVINATAMNVPRLEELAPVAANPTSSTIKVVNGLFTNAAPPQVLMRTVLAGGTLTGGTGQRRLFSNLFRPGMPAYGGNFTRSVKWTRPVEQVLIRLHPFVGGNPIEFPLVPPAGTGSTVHLKIGNLCKTNPLGWTNLLPGDPVKDDVDFKWLYHLLEPANGAGWPAALMGHRFPIPLLPTSGGLGVENCIGLQANGSTT